MSDLPHRRRPRVTLGFRKHPDKAPRRLLCQIAQRAILEGWDTKTQALLPARAHRYISI
jgi:hypothetical protein